MPGRITDRTRGEACQLTTGVGLSAGEAGKAWVVPERRSTAGRFTSGAHRRDPLIRQVIRARRAVDDDLRSESTATGDPAKVALVERAKQWVHGDPPHGALPGGA